MRRTRSSRKRRHSSLPAQAWRELRYRWHTTHKGPLLLGFVVAVAVTGLVYFVQSAFTRQGDLRDLSCLAFNVYFEARGEPVVGQYAVAEVTMNRVASGRYPDTVCGVVHQKNWDRLRRRYVSAFSWTELDDRPSLEDATFRQAWEVAESVYYGRHTPTLAGALHYHAVHIRPSWARGNKPVARIGRHLFYR